MRLKEEGGWSKMTIYKNMSDGRVGLRRQIKVLVRKGVGSNPTLNISFIFPVKM
ncbi:hypothetical protein MTR_7g116310 [Medicago truncatula]|uniref:Uncharacterized protein n=1 Tax=Medicago truncatula TaxID=3880 RepID=G7L2W8_MEDTR|nr:hypothetical protein MTR_7g116310 [Medicago truncatula]